MIDRITEQPFCQTRVSGSTFVNADCFDVFPFIEDVLRLAVSGGLQCTKL